MSDFELCGKNGNLKIHIKKLPEFPKRTHFAGGYDCEIDIEITAENFSGIINMWSSTGEFYQLNQSLKKINDEMKGCLHFQNYENNIDFNIEFKDSGKCVIFGEIFSNYEKNNVLKFKIFSDQSYLANTIKELDEIEKKYGGMTGI